MRKKLNFPGRNVVFHEAEALTQHGATMSSLPLQLQAPQEQEGVSLRIPSSSPGQVGTGHLLTPLNDIFSLLLTSAYFILTLSFPVFYEGSCNSRIIPSKHFCISFLKKFLFYTNVTVFSHIKPNHSPLFMMCTYVIFTCQYADCII